MASVGPTVIRHRPTADLDAGTVRRQSSQVHRPATVEAQRPHAAAVPRWSVARPRVPRQPAAGRVVHAADEDLGTSQVHRPAKGLDALGAVEGHPGLAVDQLDHDVMSQSVVHAARPRVEEEPAEPRATSVVDVDVQSPVEQFHADAAAVPPLAAVQRQPRRLHRPEVEFQPAAVAGVPRSGDPDVRAAGSERDRMWFRRVDDLDVAADADVVWTWLKQEQSQ